MLGWPQAGRIGVGRERQDLARVLQSVVRSGRRQRWRRRPISRISMPTPLRVRAPARSPCRSGPGSVCRRGENTAPVGYQPVGMKPSTKLCCRCVTSTSGDGVVVGVGDQQRAPVGGERQRIRSRGRRRVAGTGWTKSARSDRPRTCRRPTPPRCCRTARTDRLPSFDRAIAFGMLARCPFGDQRQRVGGVHPARRRRPTSRRTRAGRRRTTVSGVRLARQRHRSVTGRSRCRSPTGSSRTPASRTACGRRG